MYEIKKEIFQSMPQEVQSEYEYFWTSWWDLKMLEQAIREGERKFQFLKTSGSGMALIKAVNEKLEISLKNHQRYQTVLEDIESYEKRLKKIMAKLGE
jgi:hypothetical protein